jgi:hypothetical protein
MAITIRLTGMEAIDFADAADGTVCVRDEATGVERIGVSVSEAEEIASRDPELIYLVVTGDEAEAIMEARRFVRSLR